MRARTRARRRTTCTRPASTWCVSTSRPGLQTVANLQREVLQQREAGMKAVWGCRRALRRLWPTMFVLLRTRRARPRRTSDTGEAALGCPAQSPPSGCAVFRLFVTSRIIASLLRLYRRTGNHCREVTVCGTGLPRLPRKPARALRTRQGRHRWGDLCTVCVYP